jgi:PilZ domain
MIVDRQALIAKEKAERRRYLRVPVDLGGRLFVPRDGLEGPCRIVEMSPVGALVRTDIVPETGTPVVLYIEGLGRFEADVARSDWDGFGASFHCSTLKQDRVAEQLSVIANRSAAAEGSPGGANTMRRHERLSTGGLAHFTCSDGQTFACEVIDLSLSGVSLKTETKPHVGESVTIGQMSGRVVRHHDTGVAVEFGSPAFGKPETIERRLRLRKIS